MSQLTFVFRSAPHNTNAGREGVDALLAASAYCEDISVIFLGDGVAQLVNEQNPAAIQSKDYAPMLKLFDLYDIENVYVCQQSLAERGLEKATLTIDVQSLTHSEVTDNLQSAGKLLTF
ncbi:sulfurtransferase complex subunit TusC [Vibrio tapetis subsp. quintayensis]|uniref:sulfurtransferase complex subunit TusC n=1 Tax=Vibrio tapetis TaxID=52443 RepID=UPI0025B289AD|nr:sulfurtransferase complex subunit TusC [Vibrio tapetis]MDN3679384.1 sulfurtransferase complex subunit TusC [Vibrio tapetis subsp. quintayensis]